MSKPNYVERIRDGALSLMFFSNSLLVHIYKEEIYPGKEPNFLTDAGYAISSAALYFLARAGVPCTKPKIFLPFYFGVIATSSVIGNWDIRQNLAYLAGGVATHFIHKRSFPDSHKEKLEEKVKLN